MSTSGIISKLSDALVQTASATEDIFKLKAVINADIAARNALGQAIYSRKPEDMERAQTAIQVADSYAANLSPEEQIKRLEAARRMASDANRDAEAKRKLAEALPDDTARREALLSANAYVSASGQILTKLENNRFTNMLPTSSTFSMPWSKPGKSNNTGIFLAIGGILGGGLLLALLLRKR